MLQGSRKLGILLVLVSAVLWSTAGLFVRVADLDIWSMVGWRSAFTAIVLGLYIVCRTRFEGTRAVRSFGRPGLVATAVAVVASITYVASLTWTSVANVMTIYAALPFAATLLAFLWLGERITGRFILAGSVAFVGIAVMVGASFGGRDTLGILAATGMTLSFATVLVIAKRYPTLDLTQMTMLAAIACSLIALPFMPSRLPSPEQLMACAAYGVLSTGISYILVLMGGRLIGSGEAGFLSMLDVVLGPFWVWLFFDERIGLSSFIGGTIVILAVIWYLGGGPRNVRAALPTTGG
ncbi:DMT family transporter [Paracoccus benzoatiresistens]|uniref:DMT family transporter n=1 Tax=Paracoccus benzoatiresistens TaxID=2997341 RepID=A0ABT4JAT8_9RHOB|nr:DMT family transporter [Paracoccus sp. EF6]MCZ0964180.1 DMT family transporter [Paracoccus sp. EF6]